MMDRSLSLNFGQESKRESKWTGARRQEMMDRWIDKRSLWETEASSEQSD